MNKFIPYVVVFGAVIALAAIATLCYPGYINQISEITGLGQDVLFIVSASMLVAIIAVAYVLNSYKRSYETIYKTLGIIGTMTFAIIAGWKYLTDRQAELQHSFHEKELELCAKVSGISSAIASDFIVKEKRDEIQSNRRQIAQLLYGPLAIVASEGVMNSVLNFQAEAQCNLGPIEKPLDAVNDVYNTQSLLQSRAYEIAASCRSALESSWKITLMPALPPDNYMESGCGDVKSVEDRRKQHRVNIDPNKPISYTGVSSKAHQ